METKEIFEETGRLGNEIKRLNSEIQKASSKCMDIMNDCPHEIVFKYHDNHPRKMVMDGTYFCPACGKGISCTLARQIQSTKFKDSKIIPLDNISLVGDKETLSAIRNEVYSNFDFYYSDKDINELSSKMAEALKDYEYDYFKDRVFIKTRYW